MSEFLAPKPPKNAAAKPAKDLKATKALKSAKSLEPRQARSRESLQKLMGAAAEVMGRHGLDGATIPRIAAHAGLTPGAIYRRFPDKDALLEAATLRILEKQVEMLRAALAPQIAASIPLPVLAEQIVSSILSSYRAHAGLIRAMRRLVRERRGTAFYRKAVKLENLVFDYMAKLLTEGRSEIQHPEPRRAVALWLLMVTGLLVEVVIDAPDRKIWKEILPDGDQTLKKEMVRSLEGHLGLPLSTATPSSAKPSKAKRQSKAEK